MSHVLMELNASIKREATFVNVPQECQEIHTRADVFMKIQSEVKVNAQLTRTAHQISSVMKNLALVHAPIYCVDLMLSVNLKIMLVGAVVKLDLLKTQMENVFHVSNFKHFHSQTK